MHITKVADSYDDYKAELSWSELKAIESALSQHHAGAIADETYARLKFYMPRLPGPGEEKEKGDDKTLEQRRAGEELAASRETAPQELLNPADVPMPGGSAEAEPLASREPGGGGAEDLPLPVRSASREAEAVPTRESVNRVLQENEEVTLDDIPLPGEVIAIRDGVRRRRLF